ncbi:hypothetical protein MMH89_01040 [Candidatus Comchoanobacter bicostacola]|uniref:Uncharacterized protein n=1 Tax=Candidatus Comchoanobacter bicostacola TaxID=2919598 RepID=A0ABY5DKF0_9GAMM|nr:hypothetical protein [Candidatus Comchoanobacter bicostacola]UTC24741.1 hypothetical protein MMH89_01040 [Candidatus Comchoanobacter bicostacola]
MLYTLGWILTTVILFFCMLFCCFAMGRRSRSKLNEIRNLKIKTRKLRLQTDILNSAMDVNDKFNNLSTLAGDATKSFCASVKDFFNKSGYPKQDNVGLPGPSDNLQEVKPNFKVGRKNLDKPSYNDLFSSGSSRAWSEGYHLFLQLTDRLIDCIDPKVTARHIEDFDIETYEEL